LPSDVKTAASSVRVKAIDAFANAGTAQGTANATNLALFNSYTPQTKILTSVLPVKLTDVGSGLVMTRQPGNSYDVNKNDFTTFSSFYQTAYSTADFAVSGSMIYAYNAGWYQVEIAFGINQTDRSFTWHIAPALYHNGAPFKIGNYADYYGTLMKTVSTQSSFSVYLAANDSITPGCVTATDATQGQWAAGSQKDLIAAQNSYDTYFSVSLLNRSLA
jgi:hypothetical protein